MTNPKSIDDPNSDRHALVVSLKYAPGLTKEFCLIGEGLKRHGYQVRYLLSAEYVWQTREQYLSDVSLVSHRKMYQLLWRSVNAHDQLLPDMGIGKESNPGLDVICFYNVHPLNPFLAHWIARNYPGSIRTIFLHEPKKTDKRMFGLQTRFKFAAIEFLQMLCMRWTNHMILPSPNALDIFRDGYPNYRGEVHLAPIMLPDCINVQNSPRERVTMVGRVFRDGRMRAFWDLVEYAAAHQERIQFRIVTSSDIAEDIAKLSASARAILDVVNPSRLSDQEINRHVASSLAVLSMHTQGVQSGVTPVAFMNRTPIIARDLPMFRQFVRHRHNGYLVPVDASPQDWVQAIRFVQGNLDQLSTHARVTFEETFHERNWDRYYEWMFQQT